MDGKKKLYIPDLLTKAATNFVRIHQPGRFSGYQPFFLYLAYTIPDANDEEGPRAGNGGQVPTDAPYSSEPWPQAEKNKAAMITRLDRDIGRLVDRLKQLRMDDDTMIFFSSDNGPHQEGGVDPKFFQSAGPWRSIKRDLYEGGIRVPFIVRWPGHIKPGQTNDEPWAFWDFLPTAAELAQASAPKTLDGISMVPTLLGLAQTNHHDFLYWELHERGFQQAARHGDWKALRPQAGKPLELYNLKTDPGEKNNVAEQNPKVVAQFEDYFKSARTESDHWPIQGPPDQKSSGQSQAVPPPAAVRPAAGASVEPQSLR
jgi:arylsulfatase A-like enzyme